MTLRPIKTEKDYQEMLDWVNIQLDIDPELDSELGEKLQISLLLIKSYEDNHFVIPCPDPIEIVKLKMEERGLQNKDLVEWIGSKGYVSSLLNKKKPLTLKLAKIFHQQLGIPAQVLLS
jgi:HTH-type transcriptional regulator / antitoxin HigA